jgi:hypothetical protein
MKTYFRFSPPKMGEPEKQKETQKQGCGRTPAPLFLGIPSTFVIY